MGAVKRVLMLVVVSLCATAAPAGAFVDAFADVTSDRGYVRLRAIATTDIPEVVFGERIGTVDTALTTTDVPYCCVHPDVGPVGVRYVERAARWRCDRRQRTFWVAGRRTDGVVEGSLTTVLTPSCAKRLVLTAPRRIAPGRPLVARVRDTWATGRTAARLCFGGQCKRVRLRDGQGTARVRLGPAPRGRRSLTMRAPAQRVSQPVAVGVRPGRRAATGPTILTTGDSLMQSVDAIVGDRLGGVADIVSDVQLASSLTRSNVVHWPTFAREQVARFSPHATLIFLGTNDFYAMTTPDGREVECCGAGWTAEYARRAQTLMRVYAQDGTATVGWFAVPAMRDERRNPAARAVNAALERAAANVPTAHVIPTDELLTPGFAYRAQLEHGGRSITVRENDGVHLSVPGARIAATAAVSVLRSAGVL